MARVIFQNVTKMYSGNPVPAVDNLSMEVMDQEFLVLVGPSGCGKSTAMRMVAGIKRPRRQPQQRPQQGHVHGGEEQRHRPA